MFVLYYLPCLDRRPSHKKSVSYLRIVFMKNLYWLYKGKRVWNAQCPGTLGSEARMTSIPVHEIDQAWGTVTGPARRGRSPLRSAGGRVAATSLVQPTRARACVREPPASLRARAQTQPRRASFPRLENLPRGREGAKDGDASPRKEPLSGRTGACRMAHLGVQRASCHRHRPRPVPVPLRSREARAGGSGSRTWGRKGGVPGGASAIFGSPLPAGSACAVHLPVLSPKLRVCRKCYREHCTPTAKFELLKWNSITVVIIRIFLETCVTRHKWDSVKYF